MPVGEGSALWVQPPLTRKEPGSPSQSRTDADVSRPRCPVHPPAIPQRAFSQRPGTRVFRLQVCSSSFLFTVPASSLETADGPPFASLPDSQTSDSRPPSDTPHAGKACVDRGAPTAFSSPRLCPLGKPHATAEAAAPGLGRACRRGGKKSNALAFFFFNVLILFFHGGIS